MGRVTDYQTNGLLALRTRVRVSSLSLASPATGHWAPDVQLFGHSRAAQTLTILDSIYMSHYNYYYYY